MRLWQSSIVTLEGVIYVLDTFPANIAWARKGVDTTAAKTRGARRAQGPRAPRAPRPRRQQGAVAGPENKEDLGHFDFIQGL